MSENLEIQRNSPHKKVSIISANNPHTADIKSQIIVENVCLNGPARTLEDVGPKTVNNFFGKPDCGPGLLIPPLDLRMYSLSQERGIRNSAHYCRGCKLGCDVFPSAGERISSDMYYWACNSNVDLEFG